jgi:hypothetical protein
VGPSILIALHDADKTCFFQDTEMTAQIAVAQIEGLLEKAEVGLVRLCQDGEDAEANPLVDRVVEELGWVGGIHCRAWTIIPAMTPPRAAP